jgi:hypothetical protein
LVLQFHAYFASLMILLSYLIPTNYCRYFTILRAPPAECIILERLKAARALHMSIEYTPTAAERADLSRYQQQQHQTQARPQSQAQAQLSLPQPLQEVRKQLGDHAALWSCILPLFNAANPPELKDLAAMLVRR